MVVFGSGSRVAWPRSDQSEEMKKVSKKKKKAEK